MDCLVHQTVTKLPAGRYILGALRGDVVGLGLVAHIELIYVFSLISPFFKRISELVFLRRLYADQLKMFLLGVPEKSKQNKSNQIKSNKLLKNHKVGL